MAQRKIQTSTLLILIALALLLLSITAGMIVVGTNEEYARQLFESIQDS